MKVRVLGCSGAIAKDCRTTSFLIDDDVLVDAGTGVGDLTLHEMRQINHVILTHSHLDHIAALPLMEMGLADILGRDADTLARVYVLNAALGDSIRDRLFDLLLVAADEALPIDSAFVFAVEPAVDKMRHNSPLNTAGSG